MKKIFIESGRARVVTGGVESRVSPFDSGFDRLHQPAQVDRLRQVLACVDDQQVWHAWLHLSQLIQQDTHDALFFVREVDPFRRV